MDTDGSPCHPKQGRIIKMIEQRYSLAFTTSSLRKQETVKLATLYAQYHDWDAVRDQVIEHNILQQRTTSSSKKLCRELISRLRLLADHELNYLVDCPESEKAIVVWIAVCRRYRFIRDFALEVLREHRLYLNTCLDYGDFDVFFSDKLSLHDELDHISNSTKRKIRQIIFRMMREAGLLSAQNMINSLVPNQETLTVLKAQELEAAGVLGAYALAVGNSQ